MSAGRKPLKLGETSKAYTFKLTPAQHRKVIENGGAVWLRWLINTGQALPVKSTVPGSK